MAEEQSKGIQQIEGCEVIYDMGSGLVIAKFPLDKVKEQDINARIMKNEMQDQLTANIKKRGQLESLPLFVLVDGKLEIISGHHRVKSARAAEMKEIIAIVDVSGLSRSKIAAKQLAHNAISGFDDDSTLREIVKMIDDVDDMIESCLVMGYDRMEEITEASADQPVVYCRLISAEKQEETNTVAWMDGRIAVHVLCPESTVRLKMAADIANHLSLDGEVIMLDYSPMFIKRLQVNYKSDYLKEGQVFITGHYGLLRYKAKPHVLMAAHGNYS